MTDWCRIVSRPFLPKILSPHIMNQLIVLAALPEDQTDMTGAIIRSLKTLIQQQLGIRQTSYLFVLLMHTGVLCFPNRLVHWVAQVISHAHEFAGQFVPSSIHCHSTCVFGNMGSIQGSVTLWDLRCSNLEFSLHVFSFLQMECDSLASGVCSDLCMYGWFARGFCDCRYLSSTSAFSTVQAFHLDIDPQFCLTNVLVGCMNNYKTWEFWAFSS